jgi:hypothetical protein
MEHAIGYADLPAKVLRAYLDVRAMITNGDSVNRGGNEELFIETAASPDNISVEYPQDIVDITVELASVERLHEIDVEGTANKVIRAAQLHFHSLGFESLSVDSLRGDLLHALGRIVTGQSLDGDSLKEQVMSGLKDYHRAEDAKPAVC